MSRDIYEANESQAASILEGAVNAVTGESAMLNALKEAAEDYDDSGDLPALGLRLEEQLRAIELYAYDHDTHLIQVDSDEVTTPYRQGVKSRAMVDLRDVRTLIESNANWTLCAKAKSDLLDDLDGLQNLFDQYDLSEGQFNSINPFGWAAHNSETQHEGYDCTVYHYRGVEGDVDADVWEFRQNSTSFFVICTQPRTWRQYVYE
jgi:hypothetical protein